VGEGKQMDDIQFQVVARVYNKCFHLQITSGVDIILQENYHLAGMIPTRQDVKEEIERGFSHALETKLREVFK